MVQTLIISRVLGEIHKVQYAYALQCLTLLVASSLGNESLLIPTEACLLLSQRATASRSRDY